MLYCCQQGPKVYQEMIFHTVIPPEAGWNFDRSQDGSMIRCCVWQILMLTLESQCRNRDSSHMFSNLLIQFWWGHAKYSSLSKIRVAKCNVITFVTSRCKSAINSKLQAHVLYVWSDSTMWHQYSTNIAQNRIWVHSVLS